MRLFETPRKVEKDPTYQFHLELTMEDIRTLRKEIGLDILPPKSHGRSILYRMINGVTTP